MTQVPTAQALGEELVEVSCRFDPVAATRLGIHDYDDRFPDDSPAGFEARRDWAADLSARAAAIDRSALDVRSRVDLALIESRLAATRVDVDVAKAYRRQPARYPMTALAGVYLVEARPFAPIDERKESLLARMMVLPDYLEAARRSLSGAAEPLVALAVDVARAGPAYVDEVARSIARRFPAETERVEYAASRARIGFAQYLEYLERDLGPRADGPLGVGVDALEALFQDVHRLGRGCDALEAEAEQECESLRAALEAEARALDPATSVRAQIDAIRLSRPDAARAREIVAAEAERARRFVAEHGIAPIVDGRLEVLSTPSYARAFSRTLVYVPPGVYETETSGLLCITTGETLGGAQSRADAAEPSSGTSPDVALAVARAAFPGTHLQCLHAARVPSRLRRIGVAEAFASGWSLYAVERAVEHGQIVDPRGRLLLLRELLAAAWATRIDIGIHRGRMSIEEAVEALVEHCALDPARAAVQVRRVLIGAGTATCAFAGRRDLATLRAETERRWGPRFTEHEFHAAVLGGGALPPALIRVELGERAGVA